MRSTVNVKQAISRFEPGRVFGYRDIPAYRESPNTVVQAVGRMVKAKKINKLAKGQFYKPKQGLLGELKPSDNELLRANLYKDGKLRGYITGPALFNRLGLSTQVPKTITLAIEGARQKKDFRTIRIKLIEARAPVKKADINLLQYLDVLKDCKKVQDAGIEEVLETMQRKIAVLSELEIKRIQRLATDYYPPSTKAVLGLLISNNQQLLLDSLRQSLNPVTTYKLGLDRSRWPNKQDWNIQ